MCELDQSAEGPVHISPNTEASELLSHVLFEISAAGKGATH